MARRIRSLEELPKWFSLARYTWVPQATNTVLLRELEDRLALLDTDSSSKEFRQAFSHIEQGRFFGDPSASDSKAFTRHIPPQDALMFLEEGRAVYLLPIGFVERLAEDARGCGLRSDNPLEDRLAEASVDALLARIRPWETPDDYEIRVCIDLDRTDQEILDDLSRLLPAWRKRLSEITGQDLTTGAGSHSMLGKVRSYRLIPLLDLKLWEKAEDVSIPHRVLVQALYPRGELGESSLAKTVLTMLERMRSAGGFRQLREESGQ